MRRHLLIAAAAMLVTLCLGAAAHRRFLERLTEDGVRQAVGDLYQRAVRPGAAQQNAGR